MVSLGSGPASNVESHRKCVNLHVALDAAYAQGQRQTKGAGGGDIAAARTAPTSACVTLVRSEGCIDIFCDRKLSLLAQGPPILEPAELYRLLLCIPHPRERFSKLSYSATTAHVFFLYSRFQ